MEQRSTEAWKILLRSSLEMRRCVLFDERGNRPGSGKLFFSIPRGRTGPAPVAFAISEWSLEWKWAVSTRWRERRSCERWND